jgi:hypothetical protein
MSEDAIPVEAFRASHSCPQCFRDVVWSGRGRPPIFCSQACRRKAYEARHAAKAGLVSREIVRVAGPSAEPRPLTTFERIRVLKDLGQLLDDGHALPHELRDIAQEVELLARRCASALRLSIARRRGYAASAHQIVTLDVLSGQLNEERIREVESRRGQHKRRKRR